MRHRWLSPFLISVTSSIGLSAGLSAAENTFRLEEATIAEIHEAVGAGALSSEKLVELYLARIAAYDRAGPRLNSIMTINPNAKAEAAALDKERAEKGPRGPLHGIPVLLKDIDVANRFALDSKILTQSWSSIDSSNNDLPVRVRLVEEHMISLRTFIKLGTAAARSSNRPSEWRCACVIMHSSSSSQTKRPEQGRSEQGPSLPVN